MPGTSCCHKWGLSAQEMEIGSSSVLHWREMGSILSSGNGTWVDTVPYSCTISLALTSELTTRPQHKSKHRLGPELLSSGGAEWRPLRRRRRRALCQASAIPALSLEIASSASLLTRLLSSELGFCKYCWGTAKRGCVHPLWPCPGIIKG